MKRQKKVFSFQLIFSLIYLHKQKQIKNKQMPHTYIHIYIDKIGKQLITSTPTYQIIKHKYKEIKQFPPPMA
jgi:hypothetical protein